MGKNKKIVISIVLISIITIFAGFFTSRYVLEEQIIANAAQYSNSSASTTEDGRFEYKILDDGTIEITKYVETDKEVIIPAMIEGKSVTSIGDSSFGECESLKSIIIPDSVTSIGNSAFYKCSNLTICCKSNSTAEMYAKSNNITHKLDDYEPTVESVTGNLTEWMNGDVTLTIDGAEDSLCGLAEKAYSFDGGSTWQAENTKEYSENASGIVIKVKDRLGNTCTHEPTNITKIDKKAPVAGTLTMKVENSNGSIYANDTWTDKNVYIQLNNGIDEHSGNKSTSYSINGETAIAESQTLTKSGTYKIIVTTAENAGNTLPNPYTIKIRRIDSIVIKENPTKMTYEAYENFSKDGMKVSVVYDNGDKQETTEYQVINGEKLTCKVTQIVI